MTTQKEMDQRTLMRQLQRRRWLGLLAALLVGALGLFAGCGSDDNSKSEDLIEGEDTDLPDVGVDTDTSGSEDSEEFDGPRVGMQAETVLAATTVGAGTPVEVECNLLDADGHTVDLPDQAEPDLVYSPERSFIEEDRLTLVPTLVGQATIACHFPSLSLADETPAELTVEPGHPHTVVTQLDKNVMTAGESAAATCEVFDAYGNHVESAPTEVGVDASGAGIDVDGHTVTITAADVYTVACSTPGSSEERGEEIEVNPALPADLAVSNVPDQPFYDTGQVVEVATIVTDEYGNRVDDAYVTFDSNPPGDGFGHGRFRYESEGVYTVTATVDGPTKDDALLQEETEIVINGEGPEIECLWPADGQMIDSSPGDRVTFEGRVEDAQGIAYLNVNGNPATVNPDGTFESELTTRFGINFVDIVTGDAAGGEFQEENTDTCAFLAADQWAEEDEHMDDSISLWLGQQAIDDGNSSGSIDSLNDLLVTMLNSQGLRNELHQTMLAQNPIYQDCVDLWLTCYDYRVDYVDSRLGGPHETSLTLIDDGLHFDARINDIEIDFYASSSLASGSGTVDIDWVSAEFEVDLWLQNGVPAASVRQHTVQVDSGYVDIRISGLSWLTSTISAIWQDEISQMVEDAIEDVLKNEIDAVLNNLVGSLDVNSLGSTFDVPRLDGSGNVGLDFGVRFSELMVDSTRALFGVATKFTTSDVQRATYSMGVALPPGQLLLDSDPGTPISAGVHVGALNHVLHALWRAGLFDATLSENAIGGSFPDGTEITLNTGLPPVAALQGSDKLILMLGAMDMSIVYPGLFDEPLDVKIGAVARSGVQLVGGDSLAFDDIQINELYFTPIGISLDASSRDVLESFLTDVLQDVINTSLNNALPSLPVPSFEIPSSMGSYGLPAGDRLGIVQPSMGGTMLHFVIKGAFGILP
jgi:hypothetical protein